MEKLNSVLHSIYEFLSNVDSRIIFIFATALIAAFNWRLGLWRPPPKIPKSLAGDRSKEARIERRIARKARSERRNRNILIWFFGYFVRFCVAVMFISFTVIHLRSGMTKMDNLDDFKANGPGYILTLWFLLSVTAGAIRRLRKPPDHKDTLNGLWWKAFLVLFVLYLVYRLCILRAL
jgi:magnesium-transporting ATPase (P-type)